MVHVDIAGSPCAEEERRPYSSGKAWLHSILSWRAARAEEKGNARGSRQRRPIQAAAAELYINENALLAMNKGGAVTMCHGGSASAWGDKERAENSRVGRCRGASRGTWESVACPFVTHCNDARLRSSSRTPTKFVRPVVRGRAGYTRPLPRRPLCRQSRDCFAERARLLRCRVSNAKGDGPLSLFSEPNFSCHGPRAFLASRTQDSLQPCRRHSCLHSSSGASFVRAAGSTTTAHRMGFSALRPPESFLLLMPSASIRGGHFECTPRIGK
ncbi:hypothetical protein MRX96_007510 [Rhipicephalus microplus]